MSKLKISVFQILNLIKLGTFGLKAIVSNLKYKCVPNKFS